MSSSFAQCSILTDINTGIYMFCTFYYMYCAYLKKTRWTSSWWWGKGREWARRSWTRFKNFLFDCIILEYKTACLCLSFSLQSMEVIPVFVLFISYDLRVMNCSVGNAPGFKGGLWVQIQTTIKKISKCPARQWPTLIFVKFFLLAEVIDFWLPCKLQNLYLKIPWLNRCRKKHCFM